MKHHQGQASSRGARARTGAADGAHACRTVAQVRLVALRGAAVAVLATEAALTVLPNLAVLVQPCMYGDGSASLVRWASAGRQALAFAFIALKGTEVRTRPQPCFCGSPHTSDAL